MHLMLDVQTSSGGEMTLPFIYHRDAIALVDTIDGGGVTGATIKELGTLQLQSLMNLRTTGTPNAN
jgi:hypothetical protein